MKKMILFALPALAVTITASFTFATSAPRTHVDGDRTNAPKKPKISKKAKFDGQDVIDTYLTSVRSFMLVPPRDGRFGTGRVPTLHGVAGSTIPGYKEIEGYKDKDLAVWSYVAGKMPESTREAIKKSYEDYKKVHPEWKETSVAETRVSMVHDVMSESFLSDMGHLYQESYKRAMETEQLCRNNEYDEYSNSIKVEGKDGYIFAKSIRASDKSCYSCHTEIKPGQPIGYVMAIVVKKGP